MFSTYFQYVLSMFIHPIAIKFNIDLCYIFIVNKISFDCLREFCEQQRRNQRTRVDFWLNGAAWCILWHTKHITQLHVPLAAIHHSHFAANSGEIERNLGLNKPPNCRRKYQLCILICNWKGCEKIQPMNYWCSFCRQQFFHFTLP